MSIHASGLDPVYVCVRACVRVYVFLYVCVCVGGGGGMGVDLGSWYGRVLPRIIIK